jgi:serine/threonine protein kinase
LSNDADMRAEERVGTVLNDKWTLERLLGVGGMAAVYAARHRNGARAAVKVLHADLSRQAEVRERFLREGYAANKVGHPGVVKVLDDDVVTSGPDSGTAYLVMELLEGESLQDRLEQGPPVGEQEFLAIAACVLDVLEAAHTRGVVHRDLKPENLFLIREQDGMSADPPSTVRVKVVDFGLARLLEGTPITSYGLALGTPSFMSPEQAAGRIDEIDGRTDLFALAATGFRLRTGRRIQEGVNPVELVTKMANVPAPPIRTLAPDVSAPFARVIDRGLEFRREDRYDSAAEMRDDVRRAIEELKAGQFATQVAIDSGPPLAMHATELTIEVSQSDLERSQSEGKPPPGASRNVAPGWPANETNDESEESIRIPRQRSMLPWLGLIVLGGIGVKLGLDARKTTVAAQSMEATSVTVVATVPGSASTAPAHAEQPRDGGVDGVTATSGAPPASAAGSLRRLPPSNAAPKNQYKLPGTHHPRGSGTTTMHQ